MKHFKYLFPAYFILLISACSEVEVPEEGDYFFLKNDGAEMPVWVRGDTASGKFIIWVHGGPGGSALNSVSRQAVFVHRIESQFAMVYYDQRSSGNAQGNIDKSSLTIDQFVEDLGYLVDLIRAKYDDPELYLAGHSWGGLLATEYVLDQNNQPKISGLIEIGALLNMSNIWQYRKSYVIRRAKEFIQEGNDIDKWKEAMDWCRENNEFDMQEKKDSLNQYMIDAGGRKIYRQENGYGEGTMVGKFDEPNNDYVIDLNDKAMQVVFDDELSKVDLLPELSEINIPVLFIWGEKDGVMPIEIGEDGFETMTFEKKYFERFENSGHYPMQDEPGQFADVLEEFVARE